MSEIYVSFAQSANCKACGEHQDLRMGACWDCCDFIAGEKVSEVTHRLWDTRNPSNEWFCSEDGN